MLFSLILAFFSITGCIEKEPQLLQAPSFGAENQQAEDWSGQLQMEIEPVLESQLFCVRGSVMLTGNGSLPYLMLNATLSQGGSAPQVRTKYMLMQLEPNRDYGFEIAKNLRVLPGDYNCTIEASGPEGTLACETRKCRLAKSLSDFDSRQSSPLQPGPDVESAGQEFARQESREKVVRVERVPSEEIEEEASSRDAVAKTVSNDHGDLEKAEEGARIEDEVEADESDNALTYGGEKGDGDKDSQAAMVNLENNSSPAGLASAASASTAESMGMFVGSSTSKKYHLPDCRYALKIKPENRIYFQSREDAQRQGYLSCKTCNP